MNAASSPPDFRPRPGSAPVPLAAPAARPLAYLVAGMLAVLGVIAGHDFLIRIGAIERPEIIAGFVGWLDARGWDAVLPPAAIVAATIGVVLVAVAVKPRRRTHLRLSGPADAWIRSMDVGRIAARGARRCPGVLDAIAVTGSRSVTVTVYGADIDGGDRSDRNDRSDAVGDGGGEHGLADRVRAAIEPELAAAFEKPPAVKVRASHRLPADGAGTRGTR